jgi:hypothetical protein
VAAFTEPAGIIDMPTFWGCSTCIRLLNVFPFDQLLPSWLLGSM